MELYKEHKINPLSGCLPLLIQMPILIALYRALYNFKYAESAHAQFLWVASLSAIGIHQATDLIMPILSGLTTYLQSKMVSNVNDPTQKTMLLVMPFFIIWISTTVPAGLVLYWVAFNVLSIGQQYLVNRQTRGLKEALEKSGGNRKVGQNSKRGGK
jgi:YidC/Oxa1 family membrane protein insertase